MLPTMSQKSGENGNQSRHGKALQGLLERKLKQSVCRANVALLE